jgi:diguanylate cyclase (GGDEF)-like protein/PAS domain S-box-containing protein
MNLRLKLFLPFVAMFGVIYLASTLYLLPTYISFLECQQVTNETGQVELLSTALAPDLIENDIAHISTSMDDAKAKRRHWASLVLFDKLGKQVYPDASLNSLEDKSLTTISHEISSDGKIHGLMTLQFDPRPGIEKQISHAQKLHYAVLAVLVLTFLAMITFLDKLIRRPLVKLVDFADHIARGNYQTQLSVVSGDEVGSLGKSLETMRQKIHQRDLAMIHYAEIQNTIRFIQSKFISDQDSNHVFLELQCRILALTKSDAGLIGEINQNDDKSLLLKALSLNNISNIHASNQIGIQALPESDHMPELETLLGKVITTGKTVVDNGPEISTNRLGFPVSSETTVGNFIGLPLYSGYQLIGVLALVNKNGGYEQSVFNELEILLQTLAQLIVAVRERKALKDNETRLRVVVESALEGIVSADEKGSITSLNLAAERIFGYAAKQLIGRSVGLLIPPENHFNHIEAARFLLDVDNTNGRKNTEIETDVLHRNGKLIPVELSFSKVSINGKIQYTGVIRDITERKQHESELNQAYAELQEAHELLEQQNRIDPLTGLANRRYLDESLRLEWKRAQRHQDSPLTIILCDIDNFKRYNDTYGHPEGDDCLVRVSKAMRESFTRKIDLVARYGGEEFMIVLPNTTAEVAYKQADLMRRRIWNLNIEHKTSPTADRITISVGVFTIQPTRNCKLRTAIQHADEALYDAKANGRNQVFEFSDICSATDTST